MVGDLLWSQCVEIYTLAGSGLQTRWRSLGRSIQLCQIGLHPHCCSFMIYVAYECMLLEELPRSQKSLLGQSQK
jgi:hypothetical protein